MAVSNSNSRKRGRTISDTIDFTDDWQNVSDELVHDVSALAPPMAASPSATLKQSTDGRPYSMWRSSDGMLASAHGALIPSGYSEVADSYYPFKCPMRDCQRLCPNLVSLGSHFRLQHRGLQLRDNCDGTFSEVGRTPIGKYPSIVVDCDREHPASADADGERAPGRHRSAAGPGAKKNAFSARLLRTERRASEASEASTRAATQAARQPASKAMRYLNSTKATAARQARSPSLEMEDWEVAPGRIYTETETNRQNVAFSKSFLASAQPVIVANNVGLHMISVKSGECHRLSADPDNLRLCTVFVGKPKITIGGSLQIRIGPHSAFKVSAGTECVIENPLYVECLVHVVSLAPA